MLTSHQIATRTLIDPIMIDVPCLPGAAVLLVSSRNVDKARQLTAAATLRYGRPWSERGELVHELRILGHVYLEPERAEAVRVIRRRPELAAHKIQAVDCKMAISTSSQEPTCTVAHALLHEHAHMAVPAQTLDLNALDSDEHQGHFVMRPTVSPGQTVATWVLAQAA